MKRQLQRKDDGIALVITLIMLSLVTFMAVVFLAVSRREKASMTVTSDMTDAKLAADAALHRAQAEVLARIMASTNPFNYELMVSTNYVQAAGFSRGVAAPENVSYTYSNGKPLRGEDQLQNLANLQWDPRAPVVFPSKGAQNAGGPDFRFYLDFNRNGRFEPTGYQPVLNSQGQYVDANGAPSQTPGVSNYFVGDPHWIGMLEHPDQPHSESNLFVGRYAFLVQPIGKSLDLNSAHNNSKFAGDAQMTQDGFFRNQGVGSWELNLAGFLTALNPNVWGYGYSTNLSLSSRGSAFRNALDILRYRYSAVDQSNVRQIQPPQSVLATFGPRGQEVFRNDAVDGYADGPYLPGASRGNPDLAAPSDVATASWAGAENPNGYFEIQDLFDTNKTSDDFVRRLTIPMAQGNSTDERYTFYRLLAQLGVDSNPARSNAVLNALARPVSANRINLNFKNEYSGGETNFVEWGAEEFFNLTADRLIRASLVTNLFTDSSGALATNLTLGGRIVPPDFGVTNLLVYRRNAPKPQMNGYFGEVRRLLQLTANIYDARTNLVFPSVFRPVFHKRANGEVLITRFVLAPDARFLNSPWHTLAQVAGDAPGGPGIAEGPLPNINVLGISPIVGAKEGYPNFNEFTVQNAIQVSRKLQIQKPSVSAPPPWQTNQMYVLGISNVFGMEGWNSYTNDYRRPFQLMMTNRYTMALSNVFSTNVATRLFITNGVMSKTTIDSVWTNRSNVEAFRTLTRHVVALPDSAYDSTRQVFTDPTSSNSFERVFRVPRWVYYVTNRIQYVLVDISTATNRVVDMVSLDELVTAIDITQHLEGNRGSASSQIASGTPAGITPGDFWIPARSGNGVLAPTVGITNQLGVSLGEPMVGDSFWRSHNGNIVSGADKDRSIDAFRVFMGLRRLTAGKLPPPSASMEAPFTPTRRIVQTASWQANDPLVHYFEDDLVDPVLTDPNGANNVQTLAPRSLLPPSNVGVLNQRYNPWGGNPNSSAADPRAYDFRLKDPGVVQSDDWEFPTNKFPNIGWLGRVHRGTPWQTVYLKSSPVELRAWRRWSGNAGHAPTNDWRLLDVFTVAFNDNAASGLLSVNQTNLAAWGAALSGVGVLTNSASGALQGRSSRAFNDVFIDPRTPQLRRIVDGVVRTKNQQPRQAFEYLGAILATPELSDASPYVDLAKVNAISDEVVERIPQQILSLLRPDEPRMVVYAFGQSLTPAPNSLATSGNFYNICTNYQVTGESILKAVIRVEPLLHTTNQWRTVVESYRVLPPQ